MDAPLKEPMGHSQISLAMRYVPPKPVLKLKGINNLARQMLNKSGETRNPHATDILNPIHSLMRIQSNGWRHNSALVGFTSPILREPC